MNFLEIVHFLVTQTPEKVSKLNPDIPEDLEEVLHIMIAKNKRDRIQVIFLGT
jgi:hypothetical protein